MDRFTTINWIIFLELSTFSAHCLFDTKAAKDKNQTSVHTDSQPVC